MAAIAERIENQQAGVVPGSPIVNYNVAGDLVNCNLNASSIGNQGLNTQDAPIASPDLAMEGGASSGATGNEANTEVQGGASTSSADQAANVGASDSSAENTGGAPSNQSNTADSGQDNSGDQFSGVTGVEFDYDASGMELNGGSAESLLESTQEVLDSTVSASVSNSSACDFQSVDNAVGSPINSSN